MRHNKSFNHLGRKKAHRDAMLSNMAASLIRHKRINTTLAKAKALRTFVEPLITRSKDDSTHSRRVVFSMLQDKEAVTELFREVAKKVADRPGGYTRILKTGNRLGDNAEMCMMELVDYNEVLLGTKETKKSSRRRGRGKGTEKAKEATTPSRKKAVAKTDEAEAAPEEIQDAVVETAGDVVDAPVAEAEIADQPADDAAAEPAQDEPGEEANENPEEESKA